MLKILERQMIVDVVAIQAFNAHRISFHSSHLLIIILSFFLNRLDS